MGLTTSYRLRWRRRYWALRGRWRRRDLRCVKDRSRQVEPEDILCFSTIRNERKRLPYFLQYYRELGVRHFFFVDNGSEDGSGLYLGDQPDVSLWTTDASYGHAAFGVDWLNDLRSRHAHGHWTLTVDADEFLVYPFCDTRPLQALTDWLDASSIRSFGAMLLDMYPKGPLGAQTYAEGQNPFEIAAWFDSGNYVIKPNPLLENLWIQGGPRARVFFADAPQAAPALNKTPLVKWDRSYVYVSSTHVLLPRGLNRVYDTQGGEKASGALLHAKLLDDFEAKAKAETARAEHYGHAREYRAYTGEKQAAPRFWCPWSERYINWRQLEILGLMSKGNWA